MKRAWKSVVVAAWFVGGGVASPAAGGAGADSEPLTFKTALAAALAQSIEAQRAALAAQVAAADKAVLSYENDPRLTLAGNWSEYRPRSANSGDFGGNASQATTVLPTGPASRDQVYSIGINAIIYDFGRHATRMAQADFVQAVRELARDEVAYALRLQVARAYAAVIAAERIRTIAGDQAAIAARKLADVEANYRQGLRPESDVIAAQVDLGRARIGLARAKDDAEGARLNLGLLMGERAQALSRALPPAVLAPQSAASWQARVEAWHEFLPSPTLRRRAKEGEALAADEELVHAAKRPQITGSVSAIRGGPWVGTLAEYYSGAVNLSWDIPWSHMDRDELHRIGLKRHDLGLQDSAELKARRDKDDLARSSLRSAADLLALAMTQLQLTQKQHDLIDRRYASGKATALEVSTADNDLLTARLDIVRLNNTVINAVLDIAEARGVVDLETLFE